MKFAAIARCSRTVAEQKYIHARLGIYGRLPELARAEIRALIADLAATDAEGRALFDLLVRGKSPERAARGTGVQVGRLYELRRGFYDRARL